MDKKQLNLLLSIVLTFILALSVSCKPSSGQEAKASDESTYSEDIGDEIPPDELAEAHADKAATDGDGALSKYEYTWTESDNIPDVVIIVDDFGNTGALLEDYAKLPSEVVFAVLPDLSHTRKAGEIASQNGHEVLIHFPMQALSASANPGEKYLKTDSSDEEIATLLNDFYTQLPMAVGANNHMGSATTGNRTVMSSLLKKMNSKGLFFVDSATSAESVVTSLTKSLGYPSLKRDIFLDVPDNSDATLASKISSLGKYKGRREPIIIITHCHNRDKLNALQRFITQITSMGVKLTTLREAKQLSA